MWPLTVLLDRCSNSTTCTSLYYEVVDWQTIVIDVMPPKMLSFEAMQWFNSWPSAVSEKQWRGIRGKATVEGGEGRVREAAGLGGEGGEGS